MQIQSCTINDRSVRFWLSSFKLSVRSALIVVYMFLCIGLNSVLAENSTHILVITTSGGTPYQEAVTGFKASFPAQIKVNFTELTLAQAQLLGVQEIGRIKPELIYALGNNAAQWASEKVTRIPIVVTMLLKDDLLKQSANVTGVSLSYPFKTQFQWLKKFFPQKNTVAILFNPNENAALIKEAKEVSQQTGINLVTIPVGSPKELPFALEQLTNNVEVLLAIHDETVMSANTIKEVLITSFRNKVPLIGLSDNWVKSGAFYALSWDYYDLGKQCADQAQKLLKGSPVGSVHPEHPRKLTYTINAKISEQMNIEVPEDLLKNAKMVFN